MEIYFSFWTFVMFTFTVSVTIVGFALMQRSMNNVLREMAQQRARQEEVSNRLLAKADTPSV